MRRACPGRIGRAALLFVLAVPLLAFGQALTVNDSVHNLSTSGPGTVKSLDEPGVCIFCHAPHGGDAVKPLWNHELPKETTVYTPYASTTYKQASQPPPQRSKLCLGCHDGTVALGQTIANGPVTVSGTLGTRTNLGTDLRSDHPFGFTLPALDDGEIRLSLTTAPPSTGDSTVQVYDYKIECITCHDPHIPNNDAVVKKFLVRDNTAGALCTACHDTSRGILNGWKSGQHGTAMNVVAASAGPPYGTVQTNACMSCHTSHNTAGSGPRLLRGAEEASCANCHSGGNNLTPAAPNVMNEITASTYKHPVTTVTGAHDAAESLPVNGTRHAECADCHNGHAAQATGGTPTPPGVQGSLKGATGVQASDGVSVVNPVVNQYEICFKCHANSTNKPQSTSYTSFGRTPYRQTFSTTADPYNVRLDLQSSVTRHNVTQAARTGTVPSLRTAMLDLSGAPTGPSLSNRPYLYCTDCHNNDAARASGGGAPSGPHGSNWTHLLERRYEENSAPTGFQPGGDFPTISYVSGVIGPYALCDKCHDVNSLVGGSSDTVFGRHNLHVQGVGASCSVCHATHGVQGATTQYNARLINLDVGLVAPSVDYQGISRLYVDTISKTCYLKCHGANHTGWRYGSQ